MTTGGIARGTRALARKARRFAEHLIDSVLGVETEPKSVRGDGLGGNGDGTAYEPVSWLHLWAIREEIVEGGLGPVVVADFGCGAGRFLVAAAIFGVRRAIGIEVNEELAGLAVRNAERARFARVRACVEVLATDAREWNPEELDVAFLFNPFGEKTLSKVVDNLCLLADRQHRAVRLLYHNPVHRRVLDEHDRVALLRVRKVRGFLHPTLVYEVGTH